MKIITIYELLGMINDGNAPKLIKYKGYIYSWDSDFQDYVCDNLFLLDFTSICEDLQEYLQCTLEILEEEKKISEKLDHLIGYDIQQFDDLKEYVEITTNDLFGKVNKVIDTLNQVLDYLKSKGE